MKFNWATELNGFWGGQTDAVADGDAVAVAGRAERERAAVERAVLIDAQRRRRAVVGSFCALVHVYNHWIEIEKKMNH